MSVSWDDLNSGGNGENRLLPAGTRNYEVTQAVARVNDYTNKREALVAVASTDGSGSFTVPLEPFNDDYDLFLKIAGGQARGLGFTPTRHDFATQRNITQGDIDEFSMYLPTLNGAVVELYVDHKESTKMKDDGTPFVNHRVYANQVVTRPPNTPQPQGAPAEIDDLVW